MPEYRRKQNRSDVKVWYRLQARRIFFRCSTVLALVVLVVAGYYAGLYGIRLACGLTLQEEPPEYTVRLQLINATGQDTISSEVLRLLTGSAEKDLDIKIVEETRFDLREVPESFVLSRVPDLTAARLLARELGLDPGDVTYRPLEDNRILASASLIVGLDYQRIEQVEKPG
jgi:hypothetical protein